MCAGLYYESLWMHVPLLQDRVGYVGLLCDYRVVLADLRTLLLHVNDLVLLKFKKILPQVPLSC